MYGRETYHHVEHDKALHLFSGTLLCYDNIATLLLCYHSSSLLLQLL